MPIVSAQIIEKGVQANGGKKIQYKFTDHLGVTHTAPSKNVDSTFDIDADFLLRKTRFEKVLQTEETKKALEEIKKGGDPFSKNADHYSDKSEFIKSVFEILFNAGHEKASEYATITAYLRSLTDKQIETILKVDAAKVLEIRQWSSDVENVAIYKNRKVVLNG